MADGLILVQISLPQMIPTCVHVPVDHLVLKTQFMEQFMERVCSRRSNGR